MKFTTLDLHGKRHHEVDLIVENFIFLNQDDWVQYEKSLEYRGGE